MFLFNQHRLSFLLMSMILAADIQAATISVDTNLDGAASPALCQLRDAIQAANTDAPVDGCVAGSGDDVIQFSIANATITLASDLPNITENLLIQGPGIDQLTIHGDEAFRQIVSDTPNPILVTVRGLTLFQGYSASSGGCVYINLPFGDVQLEDLVVEGCQTDVAGGGINASSESTRLSRVSLVSNLAVSSGGGAAIGSPEVLIEDSLFYLNRVNDPGGGGGGLSASGISTSYVIERSTFWENVARRSGAAINVVAANTSVILQHSTVSKNTIAGTSEFDPGGTMVVAGTLTLFNTVIANNLEQNPNIVAGDITLVSAGSVVTSGFNFIGKNNGVEATFPTGVQANGDQAGTSAAQLDPDLDGLQDNGGPTLTALPNFSSPLLDNGSCPGQTADQRGYKNASTMLRPVTVKVPKDDGCDIGATEYNAVQIQILIFEDGFESEV
jgi:hypothetical protein